METSEIALKFKLTLDLFQHISHLVLFSQFGVPSPKMRGQNLNDPFSFVVDPQSNISDE